LGVVFGDIGTSPLYAFRETFRAAEGLSLDEPHVLGLLSLMTWSLVLVVTLKYLVFVMRADNHGEGGILALTSLIIPGSGQGRVRLALVAGGLFGTALLYGDGMITPAISVLSAVEGLEVVAPSLEPFVLPLAVGILVVLFSIQRRGTASIGSLFGPVMVVWFAVLATLGLLEVLRFPGVLAALNPARAIGLFLDEPVRAFLALGAVFLVVTGAEALYADMGHFGRRPIKLAWFVVVFPALMLNYYGQGALLISDPSAIDNPFVRLAPAWAALPLVILSTAATVIASQALITGAFSLTVQAVQLGYLPRVGIDHTSPRQVGQVYVGFVNWALLVACVGLVIGFGSSSSLAAAYGVAVTTTMVITTVLLYVVMKQHWKWRPEVAMLLTAIFLVVDLSFFSANILKIPDGGWFPLVVGVAVFVVMTTWHRGRAIVTDRLVGSGLTLERLIGSLAQHPQRRVPGTAVFLHRVPGAVPPALLANLRHNEVLHETIVILTVVSTTSPRVPPARRASVYDLGYGFVQITLRFGFFESPDVPTALCNIVSPIFGFDPTDAAYFLGRELVLVTDRPGMQKWREHLFALMHRNSSNAADYFQLPSEDVIEVGSRVEL
jgi:KUP system potassium uptake protein